MRRIVLLVSTAAMTVTMGACNGDAPTATLPENSGDAPSSLTDTPVAVKQGDIFDFGGLKVKVTSIVDPLESSESAYVPLPGHRFVGIGFEVTNPGSSPRPISPASEASLIDQEGGRYQMLLGQRSDDLTGQEVAPGVTVTGRIAFELPNGRFPDVLELRRERVRGVDIKVRGA